MRALLGGHAAVAGRRRRAHRTGAAPERFLRLRRQRPEAHPGNGDRNLQRDRLLGEAGADGHVSRAPLTIAFEWIATDGGPEEKQIVEMRELALCAEPPNVVDAGCRRATDFRDRVVVKGRRLARRGVNPAVTGAHQYDPILSTWN